jgi:hypothetical protein
MKLSHHLRTLLIAAAVAVPLFALPSAHAQISIGIGIHIGIAPPPLPVYVQPAIPGDGYIWTPGYWAYGDAGYYWVPGTWVLAPEPGYLWTPAYWGYEGGYYGFHPGYWGPHIGFYGGINYGFGYGGVGFCGGEWRGNHFFYNSAVVNFNGGWHPDHDRVYVDREVVVHNTIVNVNHVSYNGPGGIDRRPNADELRYTNERHVQPTSVQMQHQNFAAQDRSQLAAVNHGRPATIAAANPAAYHQVAQQHQQSQPISTADRQAGKTYNPNNREANQDQRISNGLRSGQMTSGEAARADQRQSNIDSQVQNDRQANGGTLTNQERQQVNREQNGASRQIYNENHNANTIAPNRVDNREANQQQRTAQGLRTGQETSGEAARTNANQSNLDRQVHNDRVNNGGALNQQQRQQVNRQQNQNSRQIVNEKHNNNTAPRTQPQPRPQPQPREHRQ